MLSSAPAGHTVSERLGRGQLIYGMVMFARSASWDLHAFEAREDRFPHHSTSQQMFTDEQFEAYRTLGYEAGKQAAGKLEIPPHLLKA